MAPAAPRGSLWRCQTLRASAVPWSIWTSWCPSERPSSRFRFAAQGSNCARCHFALQGVDRLLPGRPYPGLRGDPPIDPAADMPWPPHAKSAPCQQYPPLRLLDGGARTVPTALALLRASQMLASLLVARRKGAPASDATESSTMPFAAPAVRPCTKLAAFGWTPDEVWHIVTHTWAVPSRQLDPDA